MKKYFLVVMLLFSCCKFSSGQILCIYCYDQNDSISDNVNNLVVNGGFENNTCPPNSPNNSFCPNSTSYTCDIMNWTCTGGGIQTYSCIFDGTAYSVVVEGTKAAYFGNSNAFACSPVQNDSACLTDALCTVTGMPAGYPSSLQNFGGTVGVSLEQTVSGLTIGNTYVLEFWAGGESSLSGTYPYRSIFAVDIGFGKTFLRNKSTRPFTGIGTRYIIEFNATSTSHTIKLTNWGHICGTCTELVIDDVRLYSLAELDASVPHCTIGIENANFQNEENIFPNPVTNEFNVKVNSSRLSEINLYDVFSKKLLQQTFTNSVSISAEKLSKGIYFYEIRNNEKRIVRKGKIVKE